MPSGPRFVEPALTEFHQHAAQHRLPGGLADEPRDIALGLGLGGEFGIHHHRLQRRQQRHQQPRSRCLPGRRSHDRRRIAGRCPARRRSAPPAPGRCAAPAPGRARPAGRRAARRSPPAAPAGRRRCCRPAPPGAPPVRWRRAAGRAAERGRARCRRVAPRCHAAVSPAPPAARGAQQGVQRAGQADQHQRLLRHRGDEFEPAEQCLGSGLDGAGQQQRRRDGADQPAVRLRAGDGAGGGEATLAGPVHHGNRGVRPMPFEEGGEAAGPAIGRAAGRGADQQGDRRSRPQKRPRQRPRKRSGWASTGRVARPAASAPKARRLVGAVAVARPISDRRGIRPSGHRGRLAVVRPIQTYGASAPPVIGSPHTPTGAPALAAAGGVASPRRSRFWPV